MIFDGVEITVPSDSSANAVSLLVVEEWMGSGSTASMLHAICDLSRQYSGCLTNQGRTLTFPTPEDRMLFLLNLQGLLDEQDR